MSVATASIAPRDWFVSLAVHAAVLLAAMPLAAALGEVPMRPAPLQVPIRWVESPAVPAVVESGVAAPASRSEAVPTPAEEAKPDSNPAPSASSNPTPSARPTPKPKPAPKPAPAPTPQRASTATPPVEPASAVAHVREKPRPDPRLAESDEAAVPAVSEPARSATPSALEPARSAAAQSPTDDTHSVASAASGTPTAPAPAAAAPSRSPAPDAWRADLEALLAANKRYPRQARRMGQQGVVTVHARFAADGELLRCEVAASSGFRALDEAALQLVRSAAEQLRASQAPGRLAEVRVPISYELNGRGT